MLKTKNLRILPLIFFIIFSLNSCASVSQSIKNNSSITIKGRKYFSLFSASVLSRWNYDYDFLTQKVCLKKKGEDEEVSFIVGDNFFLKNKKVYFLNNFSHFYQGAIFVSLAFYRQELADKSLFQNKKSTRPKKQIYEIKTIIVDPGHGGKDPGAIGRGGLQEKKLNLKISRYLKKILIGNGLKVVLTRDSDEFISLRKRAKIADKNKDAFFVSIHANSTRGRKKGPHGFEVYYLSEKMDDWARAVAKRENAAFQFFSENEKQFFSKDTNVSLWDIIYTENRIESIELANLICRGLDKETNLRNRGIKGANFYVLKGIDLPGVLVEVGFLSNPKEEAKLKNSTYQYKIAKGIARGIMSFKKEYERTNGWTR